MHESLKGHLGHSLMDAANLGQGEFAGQHHLTEAQVAQPPHLIDSAVVHLRTGMEGHRKVHLQQCHILHDEGIHPHTAQFLSQLAHLIEFVVKEDGVERDIDLHAIDMGKVHDRLYVTDAVARSSTGSKTRSTHIDGISTVQNGFTGRSRIAGRSKEFKVNHNSTVQCISPKS